MSTGNTAQSTPTVREVSRVLAKSNAMQWAFGVQYPKSGVLEPPENELGCNAQMKVLAWTQLRDDGIFDLCYIRRNGATDE
eukprot:19187-Alexandrium_andersonii.AAC.1